MELKQLTKRRDADRIIDFLFGQNAFHWKLSKDERQSIKEAVMSTFSVKGKGSYWFYENENGEVVAAGGIGQLPDTADGYFLRWFAVHKESRRKGLGRSIVEKGEERARSLGGRLMTIDTGEDNTANAFYQKVGYKKVGLIPEYFEDRVGKVIYYKNLG